MTVPENPGRMVIMLYALEKKLHWVRSWISPETDCNCGEKQNI